MHDGDDGHPGPFHQAHQRLQGIPDIAFGVPIRRREIRGQGIDHDEANVMRPDDALHEGDVPPQVEPALLAIAMPRAFREEDAGRIRPMHP